MKRLFDIAFALLLGIFLAPVAGIISLCIRWEDGGPSLFWSKRVGIFNKEFLMPKFRSMKLNTPQLASHLLTTPENHVTRVGRVLRKYSLDEIPQLWSVLRGNMSFVGPRPALFNQEDLISLRSQKGIDILKPGITGWAQINGRDEISIQKKIEFDEYYLKNRNFFIDMKIIYLTIFKVISKEGISH